MSKKNTKTKVPVKPAARVAPTGNVPPTDMPEELIPVYDWYKENGRDFLLTLAIVLIAVFAVLAFRNFHARQNREASAALLSATDTQSLENLANQYGKTKIAPIISLRLAKARYDDGNYQGALNACDDFLKKNKKHELALEARLFRGASLEALERYDEAITSYQELSKEPAAFISAQAIMGQARCLAAKDDKAAANALLDELAIAQKDTKWETRANELRGVINRFEGFKNTSIFDRLQDAEAPQAAASEEVVSPAPATEQDAADEIVAPAPKAQPAAEKAAPAPKAQPAAEKAAPAPKAQPKAEKAAPAPKAQPKAEKAAPAPKAQPATEKAAPEK